jgi:hypothetical protein
MSVSDTARYSKPIISKGITMNTSIIPSWSDSPRAAQVERRSPARRFFGVVARPQSYRNIAYLLIGLPLGTLWFSALVGLLSVGASMLVVALLGIPLLLGTWYAVRAFANVERGVASALLAQPVAQAPMAAGVSGNPWVRLRDMSRERARWREFGYLMLRFPAGVATFTVAVTALTVPVMLAYTPIYARVADESFGDWFWSSELQDFASGNPWSWTLLPVGLTMLFAGFHALNGLANACGRWTTAWLSDAG